MEKEEYAFRKKIVKIIKEERIQHIEDIKEKWITKKGFDTHSGVTSAHALKIKYSGAGKTVLHTQS